jgi:hypothetical protein
VYARQVQPSKNSTKFYDELVLILQAIDPPIFYRFHQLVAVRPGVLGKNGYEFDNNTSWSAFVSKYTAILSSILFLCLC